MAALAACGRRTAPRPLESVAPAPQGLEARQVDDRLLLSWRLPGQGAQMRFGGLPGWWVLAERLQPDCLACPPDEVREFTVAAGDPRVTREGRKIFYLPPIDARRGAWRFRVAHRFGEGSGEVSGTVLFRGLVEIPAPAVEARRPPVSGGEADRLRLEWTPPQEALVQVLESGSPPAERALHYRGNVYRRPPDGPWPFTPRNPEPLEAPVWEETPRRGDWEYAVRLVDRFGAEGPLSSPVAVQIAGSAEP